MKTKTKAIKPIDTSISLIYACPECSQKHWISLQAAKTKGYIIVCDCGSVFKPKRVDNIKILYSKNKTKIIESKTQEYEVLLKEEESDSINILPVDLLERCVTVLAGYGFTKTEASSLLKETYKKHQVVDAVSLIKLSLSNNIGVNNEQSINQTDEF